ncbi:MAG: ABC transporter permease [Anaerohalosphaera sp.]|nr:ABC transporter permease [Anaerohalosphaera sp.]
MKTILYGIAALIRLFIQSVLLALGQIRANKIRSALTTVGLVIGVASVTGVIAALTGLQTKVLDEFETMANTNSIFIMANRPDTGPHRHASWRNIILKPEEFEDMLENCPSVEQFARTCQSSQSARFGDKTLESVSITGIDKAWHNVENRAVIMGRPFSAIDAQHARQVCLITPTLRDKLHLDRDCTGQNIISGQRSYKIIGLVEEKDQPSLFGMIGDRAPQGEIFVPFETLYKILGKPWIFVVASSRTPQLSEEAQAEIKFYLRRVRKLKPGEPDTFRLEAVEKIVEGFKRISAVMKAIAGGIVSISLVVGGVGIMNIMLVSVSERTREIGLRKAVGARATTILLQFLIEAVILCMFGGLIGIGFGQLIAWSMTIIPNGLDKAHIPFWAIILSFGFSAIVGVVFGMFPAIKAARLDPIEALRHE